MKYATIYEAILEPGEVIFIPPAAPHQVLNIGETISVAMNFIDIAALELFKEDALKNKFSGTFSHYIWLDKVLDAFDKLDLSNENAMLKTGNLISYFGGKFFFKTLVCRLQLLTNYDNSYN